MDTPAGLGRDIDRLDSGRLIGPFVHACGLPVATRNPINKTIFVRLDRRRFIHLPLLVPLDDHFLQSARSTLSLAWFPESFFAESIAEFRGSS